MYGKARQLPGAADYLRHYDVTGIIRNTVHNQKNFSEDYLQFGQTVLPPPTKKKNLLVKLSICSGLWPALFLAECWYLSIKRPSIISQKSVLPQSQLLYIPTVES